MNVTQQPLKRNEIAPAILLVGDLALRLLTYVEHLDFLLSVRDDRLATMLQFFKDWVWWLLAIAAAIWFVYEWRRRKDDTDTSRSSVGSLIFSSTLVAFLLGVLITVSATGSMPQIILSDGGDVGNHTCTATAETSRLVGFQDDYHLVLLCGVNDPTIDPQEDTRIAVSNGFHINGGTMTIVTPIAKIGEVFSAQLASLPPGQGLSFQMWHTIAVIPKDVLPNTITRVSDISKLGGRVLTPPVGGWSSPMAVGTPPAKVAPAPSSDKGKN